ncbi:MAG: S-layer homology domain-containing protein [Oscillospiraceae bacterium]
MSGFAGQAVKEMQCAGIINGKDGNRFDPQGYATRGECAKMLSILLQDIKVK